MATFARSFRLASTTSSVPLVIAFSPSITEVSPLAAPVSHELPLSLDAGQAYYWRYAWQAGERESRDALAAGFGRTFANADDAIRWLLSDDDPA